VCCFEEASNWLQEESILNLRGGYIVDVRSEDEIARTLDENGSLEGLPFMPEMRRYYGKSFRVLKRVDNMFVEELGPRRIKNAVILAGITCDGSAHAECARTCPFLWKRLGRKRLTVTRLLMN
jgi:hypothetical protein